MCVNQKKRNSNDGFLSTFFKSSTRDASMPELKKKIPELKKKNF